MAKLRIQEQALYNEILTELEPSEQQYLSYLRGKEWKRQHWKRN